MLSEELCNVYSLSTWMIGLGHVKVKEGGMDRKTLSENQKKRGPLENSRL